MAKKNWDYADSSTDKCGRMICNACDKKIDTGEFRYYMALDKWYNEVGYVTQHRHCSNDDKNWSKLDNKKIAQINHYKEMLEDCIKFKNKWEIDDLDELISWLKSE